MVALYCPFALLIPSRSEKQTQARLLREPPRLIELAIFPNQSVNCFLHFHVVHRSELSRQARRCTLLVVLATTSLLGITFTTSLALDRRRLCREWIDKHGGQGNLKAYGTDPSYRSLQWNDYSKIEGSLSPAGRRRGRRT